MEGKSKESSRKSSPLVVIRTHNLWAVAKFFAAVLQPLPQLFQMISVFYDFSGWGRSYLGYFYVHLFYLTISTLSHWATAPPSADCCSKMEILLSRSEYDSSDAEAETEPGSSDRNEDYDDDEARWTQMPKTQRLALLNKICPGQILFIKGDLWLAGKVIENLKKWNFGAFLAWVQGGI